MRVSGVQFSIASQAAWAPGLNTPGAWARWAAAPFRILDGSEPAVRQMSPLLRRRAGFLGKMALEVAYECLDGRLDVPTVFCSRHGEVVRAVDLLTDLVSDVPLSPTGFGLAVHNASAGLFSIARNDQANHIALSAGPSTVEHGVIEACGLLGDGAPMVLLVAYDAGLPPVLAEFEDCVEQPHAWAWLMVPAAEQPIRLEWRAGSADAEPARPGRPGALDVLRFQLSGEARMERSAGQRQWTWMRDA